MATLLVIVVLRAFAALLGLSEAVSELFLMRRELRFRLPGGVNHLYTGVLGALSGRWLFVSGALRQMCAALTFTAGVVLLAGPDPVPQLPVTMGHCWSIRLQKDTNIVIFKNEEE